MLERRNRPECTIVSLIGYLAFTIDAYFVKSGMWVLFIALFISYKLIVPFNILVLRVNVSASTVCTVLSFQLEVSSSLEL